MVPIHHQLIELGVITPEVIYEIRQSIHLQFAELSAKQKASILAKLIHEKIDSNLPNFSTETKKNIRMELLSSKLTGDSLTITCEDIMESSVRLATESEIEGELPQWLSSQIEIDSGEVRKYIEELLLNHRTDEMISTPNQVNQTDMKTKRKKVFLSSVAIAMTACLIIINNVFQIRENTDLESTGPIDVVEIVLKERPMNELPLYLQYEEIDIEKLREWLHGRNSLLADEPYFSTIEGVADEFNIHPLLLFAITGQEQGFVARDHKQAAKIANNPFNVYHSWEEFNTNLLESSQIAARTIVNLSKDRPGDVDAIQWINRKYAEDTNWWIGVSSIFRQLEEVVQ